MPRNSKRKTDRDITPHKVMKEAVHMVLQGGSYRKVAEEKNVSRSALQRFVKKYQATADDEK